MLNSLKFLFVLFLLSSNAQCQTAGFDTATLFISSIPSCKPLNCNKNPSNPYAMEIQGQTHHIYPFVLQDDVELYKNSKILEIAVDKNKIVGFVYTFWEYDGLISLPEKALISQMVEKILTAPNPKSLHSAYSDLRYIVNKSSNFTKIYRISRTHHIKITRMIASATNESIIIHKIKGSDGRPIKNVYPISISLLKN